MLDQSGVPIKYMQLEITESAMFEKKAEFLEIIESLHKIQNPYDLYCIDQNMNQHFSLSPPDIFSRPVL